MNLLSEEAIWNTSSIFTDSEGNTSHGSGESHIRIMDNIIYNHSWSTLQGKSIENNYIIKQISKNKYKYQSENPTLGIQSGYFDINDNIIFSKFNIENTNLNGFEIIVRNKDTCIAKGALYNGEELINTWNAEMKKIN